MSLQCKLADQLYCIRIIFSHHVAQRGCSEEVDGLRLTATGAIPDEEKNDAAVRLREFRGLAPKLFFGGTGSPKSH